MGKEMKNYIVESRRDYTEIFDNYVGAYIYAENEDVAIEMYKAWLLENGCDYEVEDMEFRARELDRPMRAYLYKLDTADEEPVRILKHDYLDAWRHTNIFR